MQIVRRYDNTVSRPARAVYWRATMLALAVAVPACGNATKHADMGVPPGHDMSGSIDMSVAADLSTPQDLTAPADLENACGYADDAFMSAPVETVACAAGQTSIAGTCAAEFWTLVADCFHPAGCCVWNGVQLSTPTSCYASGACLREDIGFGSFWYMQDGKMCGKDEGLEQNGGPGSIIHRRWTSADGRVWIYNTMTGDIQCPNGTHVNAGSGLCGYASRGNLNPFSCPSIYSNPACCTPYDPRR